jgi:hypothetical protein
MKRNLQLLFEALLKGISFARWPIWGYQITQDYKPSASCKILLNKIQISNRFQLKGIINIHAQKKITFL